MTLLHGLGVPELFSPELTAEWEFKLAQMEHGKLKREQFMREIVGDDAAHRRAGEELRERHDPGRFRDAVGALPEMRRRSARELQEVPVPVPATSACGRSSPAASSRSPRPRRCSRDRAVGPLEGFRSKLGRPFAAQAQTQRRLRGRSSTSATAAEAALTRSAGFQRARNRSVRARSAAAACSSCPRRTSAKSAVGPERDLRLSLGSRSSCSGRSSARRCRSCWPPARPTCCSFVSARTRRPFSRVSRTPARRQDRLRVRGEGTGARVAARSAGRGATALRVLGPHPRRTSPSNCMQAVTART